MPLPTFLIVGAGRSGTTTLYQGLRRHPQVFVSRIKEPNYFAFADGVLPGGPGAGWLRSTSVTTLAAYEALFAGAGAALAIGEASPRYLASAEAPIRIRETVPAARIVAILRHPVERALASFVGLRRDGLEPAASLDQALDDHERRRRENWGFGAFLDHGLYARHLGRYRGLFPKEQLRVFLFDDLVADPAAVGRELLEFIGVGTDVDIDLARPHGSTGELRHPLLRWLWRRTPLARSALGSRLPRAWRDRALAWVMSGQRKPELTPRQRDRLLAFYRDDTMALQEMLQRDLSAWRS